MKDKGNKTKLGAPIAAALSAALLLSLCPLPAASAAAPSADVSFRFSDSGVAADRETAGYEVEGTDLTITGAGTYALSGSCADGSVTVKKGTTGVTLVLNNLDLTSETGAPLSCNKTTETTLYVTGTNTLTDGEDPTDENSADEAVADAFDGAAIKVKSGASLEITGSGTLNADGSACKNGIKGAAASAVTVDGGVTLNVAAANNGLAADGSVVLESGTVTVTADNDGVKAEPDEDDADSAGTVEIRGGRLTIDAQGDGVQSTGTLTVTGGTLDITTYGGYTRAKQMEQTDGSAKGLKSDSSVVISGGTFTLNCADDAVHSNGDVSITGGTFDIRTGDDAFHADNDLTIDGPSLTVETCVEGLEGARIWLESGSGSITASDDGVNAATDLAVQEIAIWLDGGTWTIDAGGDGLDAGGDSRNNSGGTLYINGGNTTVFGAANGGNAGIDADSGVIYKGGRLLVVDYSGMNQTPTNGTYVFFGSAGMCGGMNAPFGGMGQQAGGGFSVIKGSAIAVKDSTGNTLASATGTKNANCVTFCDDSLVAGQTYTLYVNNQAAATATAVAGTSQGGMNQGGMDGMTPPQQTGGAQQGNMTPPEQNNGTQQTGMTPPQQNNGSQQGNMTPPQQTGGTRQNGMTPPEQNGGAQQDGKTPPEQTAQPFTDVADNAWYRPSVDFVRERQIMNGVSSDRFAPETSLSRGMMAQILYNLEGRPAVSGGSGFADVTDGAWYADAVSWAKGNGVVSGCGNGSFAPEDPLTRAQSAVILRNYARFKGQDMDAAAPLDFQDACAVPAWAGDALSWGVQRNIFQGSNRQIRPNDTANRAEIAAVMMRFLSPAA